MNMNGVKRIAQISTARRLVIRLETTKVFYARPSLDILVIYLIILSIRLK